MIDSLYCCLKWWCPSYRPSSNESTCPLDAVGNLKLVETRLFREILELLGETFGVRKMPRRSILARYGSWFLWFVDFVASPKKIETRLEDNLGDSCLIFQYFCIFPSFPLYYLFWGCCSETSPPIHDQTWLSESRNDASGQICRGLWPSRIGECHHPRAGMNWESLSS